MTSSKTKMPEPKPSYIPEAIAKLPRLPQGPSIRRLGFSLFMQAVTIAVLFKRMQDSGITDVVGAYIEVYNPRVTPCGWLPHKEYVILSDRVVGPHGTAPGAVHIRGGRIAAVKMGGPRTDRRKLAAPFLRPDLAVLDYGNAVIGPGLIDTHVHMNEPGREDWEGIASATSAAAAGGITTLVDMPLNSNPCTTTAALLRQKISIASMANKTHVNVAFWAGLVPENAHSPRALRAMVKGGALGFKAFMSPSGIDDFPHVGVQDMLAALPTLKSLGVPLLVHAEIVDTETMEAIKGADPRKYSTWLASRPPRFERRAAAALIAALDALPGPYPPGFGIHVVHVADIEALKLLTAARTRGLPLSVETGPHYLTFAAEDIPDGDTRFKCAPPLRGAANRDALLEAVAAGEFDSLASDHSPALPELKELASGDFLSAWGGIAGLQYALPATWEALRQRKVSVYKLHDMWSRFPAALAGLSRKKGLLAQGYEADIVVWSPDESADTSAKALHHRHKLTPYEGRSMQGRVIATFVRGSQVYDAELGVATETCGKVLLYRQPGNKRKAR